MSFINTMIMMMNDDNNENSNIRICPIALDATYGS